MPAGIRAKENRTITISINKALVQEIDALAKSDNRSRSNWIVDELQKLIHRKFHHRHAFPMAAETPPKYKAKPPKRPPQRKTIGSILTQLFFFAGGLQFAQ